MHARLSMHARLAVQLKHIVPELGELGEDNA